MRIIDVFCKVCTIIFLTDIIIKHNKNVYNKILNEIILFLSTLKNDSYILITFYKIIYIVSRIHVFYNCVLKPKITFINLTAIDILEKYKLIDNLVNYNINFYQNNELVHNIPIYDKPEINKIIKQIYTDEITTNSLMIVSDCSNSKVNPIINMKIYYEEQINFIYEMSSIKFLNISMSYKNITYDINLLTNKYNFYIVGNKLDKLFVFYYLKFILNEDINNINLDDVIYSLELCDHNANFMILNQNDTVIIGKENYQIIIKDTPKMEGEIQSEHLEYKIEDEFVVT